MKDIALITIPTDEALRARMRAAAPEFTFHFLERREQFEEIFPSARILFGRYNPAKLPLPEKLEWLQVVSSGVDWYVAPGALPPSTVLTAGTGSYGTIISEFMVGQLLSLYYNLPIYRDQQRAAIWAEQSYPTTIAGKTALILGLGSIGSAFAEKMRAFGAYTIGVRRRDTDRSACADELYLFDDPALNAQFARADIVALCMPQTPETIGMLSAGRIALLKKSAVILNAGRGSAIDQPALTDALLNKRIAGAALDVCTPEPLPASDPLWQCENVLITPHIAGRDYAPAVIEKTIELFFENLAAFRENRPLRYVVDREKRYCADRTLTLAQKC